MTPRHTSRALRALMLAMLACFALTALAACKASVSTQPSHTPSAQERTESVTAGALNVRSEPSSRAAILGKLYKGQTVAILGRENNWIRVRSHKDGLTGWVYGAYLTGYNIAPSQPSQPSQSAQPAQQDATPMPAQAQEDANAAMDEISGTVSSEEDVEAAPEPADDPAGDMVQPLDENEIEGSPHGTTI